MSVTRSILFSAPQLSPFILQISPHLYYLRPSSTSLRPSLSPPLHYIRQSSISLRPTIISDQPPSLSAHHYLRSSSKFLSPPFSPYILQIYTPHHYESSTYIRPFILYACSSPPIISPLPSTFCLSEFFSHQMLGISAASILGHRHIDIH